MLEHLAPSFAALNPELFEKLTMVTTHHADGSVTTEALHTDDALTLEQLADEIEDTPEGRERLRQWILRNRPPQERVDQIREHIEIHNRFEAAEAQAREDARPGMKAPAWLLERFKPSFWRGKK